MQRVDSDFKERVYQIVGQIPKGKVMSYGQIAAMAGAAWAAWEVGQIAHTGPSELPWQRVVNKTGGLAKGYPGGYNGHKSALEAEGVAVDEDFRVDIGRLLWRPPHQDQKSLL
jgi:methylated-DNA-protein-cysteine methyltransferase related protein